MRDKYCGVETEENGVGGFWNGGSATRPMLLRWVVTGKDGLEVWLDEKRALAE